jgi:Family of unknown function (DUF6884)
MNMSTDIEQMFLAWQLSGRMILLGGVRPQRKRATYAANLYNSPLWKRRHAYADRSGSPMYILSAEHGLLMPGDWIKPYDVRFTQLPLREQHQWGQRVVADIVSKAGGDVDGWTIELHAEPSFVDLIRDPLEAQGATVLVPLAGLSAVAQLDWYDAVAVEHKAA